ncbi:uncharacterized protein PV09_04822 [Verruconis gallopava]|uniref:Beta-lactamase-related domain-containing protein n=1 Tax=Verruconis gallopava TaxID=253628 RepID=A0A0D1YTM7_9PEZI|nr:uncharacterized protein PV09_04822 [Verruconis gallopava]KIW03992.1 hypothetical protein PV09_04822 [Verruconis gallopava]
METRLNAVFEAAVDSKKVSGVGGIVLNKDGNVLWKGSFGPTNILDPSSAPFTVDTPFLVFSCTKLVTSILALQFLEEGKLKLEDPVEKYEPEFAKLQILEGFDADDKPETRPPKAKATILNLMTHTSGLSYDFLDPVLMKWRVANGQQPAQTMTVGTKNVYQTPLVFEPGEKYAYGLGVDWLGFVLEAISGKKLAELVEERIIKPLQLKNTGPRFVDGQTYMAVHVRGEDGSLISAPDLKPLDNPEVRGGGEFLVSTLRDYSQILLPLLNGGEHPILKVRILKPETVQNYLFTDLITPITRDISGIGRIGSVLPYLCSSGELLPGVKKTWSAGLLLNEEDNKLGRKAGSGCWAGVSNSYYLVDPASGKLAFFTSSIIPFLDPESLHLWDEMERAMYGHEAKKTFGEAGGNHGPWSQTASL